MRNLKCFGAMLFVALNPFIAAFADAAPEPVVKPLMLKDLADVPGKEMLMITVDYHKSTRKRREFQRIARARDDSFNWRIDGDRHWPGT
jgi:hypothetical protein